MDAGGDVEGCGKRTEAVRCRWRVRKREGGSYMQAVIVRAQRCEKEAGRSVSTIRNRWNCADETQATWKSKRLKRERREQPGLNDDRSLPCQRLTTTSKLPQRFRMTRVSCSVGRLFIKQVTGTTRTPSLDCTILDPLNPAQKV